MAFEGATGLAMASYVGCASASANASKAARGSSKKRDSRCELLLRKELYRRGLRYRIDVKTLPGRPDIVFRGARVVVFCDGDFWHGRNLDVRLAKLAAGHNPEYWVEKICANVTRDRTNDQRLREEGWTVIRLWEKEILKDPSAAADSIVAALPTKTVE